MAQDKAAIRSGWLARLSNPQTSEDELFADEALIAEARLRYANRSDGTIEVDDNALVSKSDDGAWVSAWLWVPSPESEEAVALDEDDD